MTSFVYFIQRESGPIKIGLSRSVETRLANLRTSSSEPLTLLHSVEGGPNLERFLHNTFACLRLSGEWFRPESDLTDFIASLKAGLIDLPNLDEKTLQRTFGPDVTALEPSVSIASTLIRKLVRHSVRSDRRAQVAEASEKSGFGENRTYELMLPGRAGSVSADEMRQLRMAVLQHGSVVYHQERISELLDEIERHAARLEEMLGGKSVVEVGIWGDGSGMSDDDLAASDGLTDGASCGRRQ